MRTRIWGLIVFALLGFGSLSIGQMEILRKYQRPGVEEAYQIDVDVESVRGKLLEASPIGSSGPGVLLKLPLADGSFREFELYEAPLMKKKLSRKYPGIKCYKGFDTAHPSRMVRLNVGPLGLFAVISDERDQCFIQPFVNEDRLHDLYYSKRTYSNWACELVEEEERIKAVTNEAEQTNNCTVNGTDFHTYDLVVATTGEFYNLNGSNMSMALNALVNRLAAMAIPYERDLAMTFQLVGNNDTVMFTDPNTDPFSDPTNTGTSLNETESTIESYFSNNEYDIGHGYHEITCGGSCGWAGIAGVAVGCVDGDKARGYTYQPNDIATNTVFSHEFGHQLSCWHTNYGCGNTGCHRYEPGKGVTIMSTGAGCSSADDYGARVDYFHAKSIDAILEYTNNGVYNNQNNSCSADNRFNWTSCVADTSSGNTPPNATANPNALNLTIPISTPFFLEGQATDPEGNSMTYNWVDYNTNVNTSTTPQNSASSTTAPLFRWFVPGSDTFRLFPQLSSILDGNNTSGTGEVLPTVGRSMDFRFIARDNASPYGAIACDEITVTVDGGSGPFEISSQNTSTTWTAGNTETITWNVNNTDQAPINASNVDILLSTDGGQSFQVSLATGTPNDGSHDITVPNFNSTQGRIKIQPSGNYIFFDINDANITIEDPNCSANAYSISPTSLVSAPEGDHSLNLAMENEYGSPVTSHADSTTTSDPTTNIAFESASGGSCSSASDQPHTKIYVVNVSTTGSYTISHASGDFPLLMNMYSPEFFVNAVCSNWVASNGQDDGTGTIILSSSFSPTLNANQDYELTVNGVYTGNTKSYTLSFSGPGDFYLGYIPISGFSYTYVIVNDSNDEIVDFDANTDLTDDAPGNYTIYGVHYDNNVNLTSYIGGTFATFQNDISNGNICASISSNSRPVEIQSVLPLTFVDFFVKKQNEVALLEWEVSDAYNVSHFEIEKWNETNNHFQKIGEVDHEDDKFLYKGIDTKPRNGSNHYRIKSVDLDGSTQSTPVRVLYFSGSSELTVYPSPADAFIKLQGELDRFHRVKVFNAGGREVLNNALNDLDQNLPTHQLPEGFYILELYGTDAVVRKRFIVDH